jgi:hypothetical protein
MSQVSSNTAQQTPIKSVLEEQSLEKWKPTLASKEELYDALDKALDYRGDVTVTLRDGTQQVVYVFNREAKAAEPFIEAYPAEKDEKIRIYYKDIAGLYFSGIDTAAGKSWAVWMAKYMSKENADKAETTKQ